MKAKGGERFFTQDRDFYRTLFSIFTMVTLQNVVAYSVNMLDNIMLGSYAQAALSGAATVPSITGRKGCCRCGRSRDTH